VFCFSRHQSQQQAASSQSSSPSNAAVRPADSLQTVQPAKVKQIRNLFFLDLGKSTNNISRLKENNVNNENFLDHYSFFYFKRSAASEQQLRSGQAGSPAENCFSEPPAKVKNTKFLEQKYFSYCKNNE
jgi:hypothetical protein